MHKLTDQLPNWHMLVPTKAAHESSGVQHIKFLLLVYKEHMRFVISTGNMIGCDWDYIENVSLTRSLISPCVANAEVVRLHIFTIFRSRLLRPLPLRSPSIQATLRIRCCCC